MISEEQVRIYNKTLEPNLWDENQKLKPEVRLRLLKVAKDFYTSTEFKSELIDILLLGSSVNYTWTPESDIDVHLVMDISKEGLDTEHYRTFLDSVGGNFNKEHEITIDGHKVEVYLQDITEKNSTPEKARKHGAMYSLLHDKWLVPPKYEPRTLDKDAIRKAFHTIKDQINSVIKSGSVDGLKELMKAIRDYRNKGMESGEGEFSVENIVFKALRHTGLLQKLKDGINTMYDRLVSIEEMESYLNKLNSLEENIVEELISETITELNERDKPYILIGSVDNQGAVYAMKTQKTEKPIASTQPYETHNQLKNKYDINHLPLLDWRYRSDTNELLYYEFPSEIQSLAVKDYIRKNCKIIADPKVLVGKAVDLSRRFHDLDYKYTDNVEETLEPITSKDFIVTGMISHDLDVVGDAYQKGGELITHGMIKSWYGSWANSIDWRYRHDEHKVYYKEREPSPQQKEVIIDFLRDEFDVTQVPRFVPMTPENKPDAHYFLREGIIDRKANFYLGWVKRSNLKVVATDIHPETEDSETYNNYQRGMSDVKDEYDSNLVRWRYRRDKNSIYWWSFNPPTDEEKQAVQDWVEMNLGVKDPYHRIMYVADADSVQNRNREDAHGWD